MEADRKDPKVFLRGIDKIIRRDLAQHKEVLAKTQLDLQAFRKAVNHESQKKRHYYRQIGKGKFDDEALLRSMDDIRINIRHLSDKVKLSLEKIEHETLIVTTLTAQLEEYEKQHAARNRYIQQIAEDHQSRH